MATSRCVRCDKPFDVPENRAFKVCPPCWYMFLVRGCWRWPMRTLTYRRPRRSRRR